MSASESPLPTSRILSRSGSRFVQQACCTLSVQRELQARACSASCRSLRFRVSLGQDSHDVSFPASVDMVLHVAPTSPPAQCQFIQVIDTDITLLPNYIKNGSCSFTPHDPYLPSAPVSPQTLDRVGCERVPSASHPLKGRNGEIYGNPGALSRGVVCFALNSPSYCIMLMPTPSPMYIFTHEHRELCSFTSPPSCMCYSKMPNPWNASSRVPPWF